MGTQRVRHDRASKVFTFFIFMIRHSKVYCRIYILIIATFIECFLCARHSAKFCPYIFFHWILKMKVKVAQACPTLWDPMDYTVHGILWARILEWLAFAFSRGSSQSRDWTQVSPTAGKFFTSWATREPSLNPGFTANKALHPFLQVRMLRHTIVKRSGQGHTYGNRRGRICTQVWWC